MVISDSNKGSYFLLTLELEGLYGVDENMVKQKIENSVDIILASMKVNDEFYKFVSRDKIIYLFATTTRKRNGQLNKLVEKNLVSKGLVETFDSIAFLKSEFYQCLEDFKTKKSLRLVAEPTNFSGYTGNDIKFFEGDRSNWYPWQLQLDNLLFDPEGEIRPGDPRKIFFIVSRPGCEGKSSWCKFKFFKNPKDIGKLSFGSAAQLRSSLINMGPKKIYFIDIPRSKEEKASNSDLLNIAEELKNGFLQSSFYGKNNVLIMSPPHIVIMSNYLFEDTGLSKDRWVVYEIVDKMKKMKDITKEVLNQQMKRKIRKKQIVV